jgi:hypothetical protein
VVFVVVGGNESVDQLACQRNISLSRFHWVWICMCTFNLVQHKLCATRTVVVHTGIWWGATRKISLARPGHGWGDNVNRMGDRGLCDLA